MNLSVIKTAILLFPLGWTVHPLFGQPENIESKVAFLGVSTTALPPSTSHQLGFPEGIYLSVDQVSAESPAEQAGLQLFDVMLRLDEQILVNSDQLKALVRMKNAGDRITLHLVRKGNPLTVHAVLSEIDLPIVQKNQRSRMWGNLNHSSNGSFSRDLDRIFPHMDPSIRDLLRKNGLSLNHGFEPSLLPDVKNNDASNPLHGSSGANVQSFSSTQHEQTITIDESGTFEYYQKDGDKHFRVTHPNGGIIFDGLVNTTAEREKLLPEHLTKLQDIENRF